ncbi:MAG: MlaE family lipid ABC transporter permease subunit [Candidatus Omnitrophica bacterium]|nr:MlaE family lipid ABC transporter permease subunit [Candidatus Omnitrophota bacterium]
MPRSKFATLSPGLRTEELPQGGLRFVLEGALDTSTVPGLWRTADTLLKNPIPRLEVDAKGLQSCDGHGIALLVHWCRHQSLAQHEFHVEGLRKEYKALFELFPAGEFRSIPESVHHPVNIPEEIGEIVLNGLSDIRSQVAFVGELAMAVVWAFRHPRQVRWKDAWLVAEQVGVNALPIVCLIGFLMGLIMAFQSAIPMKQFGADVFLPNLVGLAMLRELGPLMTAVVLAGRSGSAFAAEIGTMKINEEVDALNTMGVDSLRFLVLPRVIAAVVMMPLLTLFANVAGLIGGLVVFLSMGYPFITYVNQLSAMLKASDLWGGLIKALVFAVLVASAGCLRGLETRLGASAVGVSTTRAVVSGIILIAVADGVLSVVYYYLGI